jgi:hypothetical protein
MKEKKHKSDIFEVLNGMSDFFKDYRATLMKSECPNCKYKKEEIGTCATMREWCRCILVDDLLKEISEKEKTEEEFLE